MTVGRVRPEEVAASPGYRVLPGVQELLTELVEQDTLLGLVTGNIEGAATSRSSGRVCSGSSCSAGTEAIRRSAVTSPALLSREPRRSRAKSSTLPRSWSSVTRRATSRLHTVQARSPWASPPASTPWTSCRKRAPTTCCVRSRMMGSPRRRRRRDGKSPIRRHTDHELTVMRPLAARCEPCARWERPDRERPSGVMTMLRQRIRQERKPARRADRQREVLPVDPRDPDVVRVKMRRRAPVREGHVPPST